MTHTRRYFDAIALLLAMTLLSQLGCKDSSSSPAPVTTTPPPLTLEELPGELVVDGAHFAQDAEGVFQFTDPQEWGDFWSLYFSTPLPAIDFSSEMVLGVVRFAPGTGHAVIINGVDYAADTGELIVRYYYYEPCNFGESVTFPYSFVVVPRRDGVVILDEVTDECQSLPQPPVLSF